MALHAVAITLSSFLLFLVQPIIARRILPWFGGSAGVWTTCMVFFQVALVAGYAYSDVVARRLSLRRQLALHLALVALSLLFLPIVPAESLKPADASMPALRILWLLAVTVGLPYFLLSTTGPLVQAWSARVSPGARVYRLYALSNVASLGALASYPFLVEPRTTGRTQALAWSAGYALFAVAVGGAAWRTLRRARGAAPAPAAAGAPLAVRCPAAAPGARESASWFALAMLGSTLLLVVTTHLTQNVAPVPLLWVLPLSIYLLTFVLCFDGRGWYLRRTYTVLAAASAVAMLAGALPWRAAPFLALHRALPLYGVGLFAACMVCHGELALRKPAPAHLTRFYLVLSLGGAAGGVFVGIVAPLVFSWHAELPLALCALALVAYAAPAGRLRFAGAAALLASVALAVVQVKLVATGTVARSRSFYGTLRIEAMPGPDARLGMVHGVTLHGEQHLDPARRRAPTAYFGETSGIGRTFSALPARPRKVGIVGMGVGTLAAYARPQDLFTFYELDPDVVRQAQAHFSFLRDSGATVETVLGDGRLSLEREPPRGYDLLVVDAFSSDAIPAHLLTLEAATAYRRHLAAGGVLAFHVSNNYLELGPVVRGLADALGLEAVRVVDAQPEGGALRTSDWVIASSSPEVIRALRGGGGRPVVLPVAFRAWTDDFHDVFGALKHAPARAAPEPNGTEAGEARRPLAAGQERARSGGAR